MESRAWVLTPIFVLAIVGCGEKIIDNAKSAVIRQLKDPQSAQFEQLTKFSEGVVCGNVNAKNAMGGYVGFKPFIFNGEEEGEVDLKPGPDSIADFCSNKPMKKVAKIERSLASNERILADMKLELVKAKAGCDAFPSTCLKLVEQIKSSEKRVIDEQDAVAAAKAKYTSK